MRPLLPLLCLALLVATCVLAAVSLAELARVRSRSAAASEPRTLIPHTLFMTGPWAEADLPAPMRTSLASWRKWGPRDLRVRWFDEPAREAWVAAHFPQFLQDYRALVPGAYQADLWRALVVHTYGGVYSDAGTLLQDPLWNSFGGTTELVVCRDLIRRDICNGLFAAVAGHPALWGVITRIIQNIRARHYGKSSLAPTGPEVYGVGIRAWVRAQAGVHEGHAPGPWSERDQEWSPGHYPARPYRMWVHRFEVTPTKTVFMGDAAPASPPFLVVKVPGYQAAMYGNRGVKHYGELWRERAIYHPSVPIPAQLQPRIPRRVYMTGPFALGDLPASLRASVDTWRQQGVEYAGSSSGGSAGPPEVEVQWFDDAAARAWVAEHRPQYLPEYDALVPGAYKADLWRLLILHAQGGVYADAGTFLKAALWDELLDPHCAQLVLCRDRPEAGAQGMIWQGVLGATAGHPVIGAMIARVVRNIRERSYGQNLLDVTGPCAVAAAAVQALQPRLRQLTTDAGAWAPGDYGDIVVLGATSNGTYDWRGRVVLTNKFPGYYSIMYRARKTKRYGQLWRERAIYADSAPSTAPGSQS